MVTAYYNLDEEDYLAFQLHNASISGQIAAKRKKTRVRVPIAYVIFGLLLLWADVTMPGLAFVAFAILWYFFYPKYEAKKYEKHFRSHVQENFKADPEKAGKLELGDEYICGSNSLGESKIKVNEVERIDETADYIFIRISNAVAFVVPKQKVENLDEVNTWLQELQTKLGIERQVNLDWKWQ
ncbi:MAG: YcxB family protein [Flavobacteriales bacterium]|nr:YcxB family protein [Flavobacteriales bacterium]